MLAHGVLELLSLLGSLYLATGKRAVKISNKMTVFEIIYKQAHTPVCISTFVGVQELSSSSLFDPYESGKGGWDDTREDGS